MTVPHNPTDRADRATARTSTGGTGGRADRLIRLAGQVASLCPDRRDPERFHIMKSEIIHTLRRMAREASR